MVNRTGLCGDLDLDYATRVEEIGTYIDYYIVAPIYFIMGTPGHILLLIVFYKQMKEDSAYMYQVFVTVSELVEIQGSCILGFSFKFLSGAEYTEGVMWFRKSYFLMYYTAHLAHNNYHTFFTLSLLLSIAMTGDRVFALAYPFKYKNINGKKHKIIAVIVCILISATTSFSEELYFTVIEQGDHYAVVLDPAASKKMFVVFLGQLRNAIRCVGLLILVGLNIIMVRLYHKRFTQVSKLTGNDERQKQAKAQEKTLLTLTICQSIFQGLSVLSTVLYQSTVYASPYFALCTRYEYYSFKDMTFQICDILELYVTFGINKQFRNQVLQIFACCKKGGSVHGTKSVNAKRNNDQGNGINE